MYVLVLLQIYFVSSTNIIQKAKAHAARRHHDTNHISHHDDEITPDGPLLGNEHYKDQHLSYPAHPGPRHPQATHVHNKLPIRGLPGRPAKPPPAPAGQFSASQTPRPPPSLTKAEPTYVKTEREPEEDEGNVMRSKRAVKFQHEERQRDVGTTGSGGRGGGSAGSETVVGSLCGAGSEPLESELGSLEVQDWAARGGGKDRSQEATR